MSTARDFLVTVTERGAAKYSRQWPAKEWLAARDDYFLQLFRERKDHGDHMRRLEDRGARILPCSVEGGGVLIKIERAALAKAGAAK